MDTAHSAITEPARRLEGFTKAGRPRKWSNEEGAGWLRRSWRAAPRFSVARRTDCHRSSCLAARVICEKQQAVISK